MPQLPRGTVTFLFTDIEGSTARWERDRQTMEKAVTRHIELLRAAITDHGGVHFKTIGDAVQAAFPTTPEAVIAAVEAQRALLAEDWGTSGPLQVRMALHTGAAIPQGGDYLAAPLNRLSRLLAAGHGGQVLLTQAVQQLVRDALPSDVTLRDLGAFRLRDLQEPEVVFQVLAPGLPQQFPTLRAQPTHAANLPLPPTRLIGRESEIAAVWRHVEDGARLVTLTGPGGSGKTRLAQEIAADALSHFPDGVAFVDLVPLREAKDVLPTMASVLGVRQSEGESLSDAFGRVVADRRLLVVLDNCEHVLGAAADLAALLASCPNVTVLATSREPLRLRAEQILPVPPLVLPNRTELPDLIGLAAIPAVALFVERAQDVDPSFMLSEGNGHAVAAICQRLDGLPLAIELAAARVRHLPPPALLARLERTLPVLTGGAHDAPARHRTLRQTIAWSHDLLTPDEQAAFRALAVFVGGCTIAAAEAVAPHDSAEVLDTLGSLADKNLIALDGSTAEPRYRMLETIREFALERLAGSAEEEQVHRAFLAYVLQLATANDLYAGGTLSVAENEARWNRLSPEEGNVRAAQQWALSHDPEAALALSARFAEFWRWKEQFPTGLAFLERALGSNPAAETPDRARALEWTAVFAIHLGDVPRAEEVADAAFALAEHLGEASLAADARSSQGAIAMMRQDGPRATALLEDALARYEALGERRGVLSCLADLGANAYYQGDAAAAIAYTERLLALAEDDPYSCALGLANLAHMHRALDRPELAQDLAGQALALAEESGGAYVKQAAWYQLARLALDRRALALAAMRTEAALSAAWKLGLLTHLAEDLELAATAMIADQRVESAARTFGAAEALRERLTAPLGVLDRAEYERHLTELRAAIDAPAFTRAWQRGRVLPLAETVAEARAAMTAIAEQRAAESASPSLVVPRQPGASPRSLASES